MNTTLLSMGLRLRGARYCIVRQDGGSRVLFGIPAPAFVHACGDVLDKAGIDSAWVAQAGAGGKARLIFPGDMPENVQQRIRNVWTPPPGPGKSGARGAG